MNEGAAIKPSDKEIYRPRPGAPEVSRPAEVRHPAVDVPSRSIFTAMADRTRSVRFDTGSSKASRREERALALTF